MFCLAYLILIIVLFTNPVINNQKVISVYQERKKAQGDFKREEALTNSYNVLNSPKVKVENELSDIVNNSAHCM